eukprot:TRINITY_DN19159_c0_g1_i1.p1 TRINITY_DN19159_c0_g1~~TRINITY_DN19159_c0_g1_i1.p1  ORF type:complete len:104 (-),score=3.53 TRINITY_DN19159_c0_g1_i1:189-500(-)
MAARDLVIKRKAQELVPRDTRAATHEKTKSAEQLQLITPPQGSTPSPLPSPTPGSESQMINESQHQDGRALNESRREELDARALNESRQEIDTLGLSDDMNVI